MQRLELGQQSLLLAAGVRRRPPSDQQCGGVLQLPDVPPAVVTGSAEPVAGVLPKPTAKAVAGNSARVRLADVEDLGAFDPLRRKLLVLTAGLLPLRHPAVLAARNVGAESEALITT